METPAEKQGVWTPTRTQYLYKHRNGATMPGHMPEARRNGRASKQRFSPLQKISSKSMLRRPSDSKRRAKYRKPRKCSDFGIAKTTGDKLTDKTLFTQFHSLIGTPAYISPEQAEMSSVDIDTRSDIYSLGVLLYELLTGQTPFSGTDLMRAGLDEMRRTIRDDNPVKPSTRLTREASSVEARRLDPRTDTHQPTPSGVRDHERT